MYNVNGASRGDNWCFRATWAAAVRLQTADHVCACLEFEFSYASSENLTFQCPALSLDPPENAASGFAQDPKKMVALKGSTAQKYTTKMNKESRKSTGKPTE